MLANQRRIEEEKNDDDQRNKKCKINRTC
jgi:hypothetical protein